MGINYFFIILAIIAEASSYMDIQCLKCICEVMTGCKSKPCDPSKCGKIDGNNYNCACGPFAITPPYWIAANRPMLDDKPGREVNKFKDCAETLPCSIWAVQYYMQKNAVDCDGDRVINCDDYVLIHYHGNGGCRNASLDEKKLEKYKTCMDKKNIVRTEEIHDKKKATTKQPNKKSTTSVKPEELDVDSIENIDPFDKFDDDDKVITDDSPQQMREWMSDYQNNLPFLRS